jgi:hypothetical protein
MKKRGPAVWVPTSSQIEGASKDVAWEYAAMTAAALEITKSPKPPVNHLVQEAFLVHVRNLVEFFRSGVDDFRKDPSAVVRRSLDLDNIFAVDFCHSAGWNTEAFGRDWKLDRAINKTLSHMTYSRDRASETHAHFEAHEHLHGTVGLMRRTWGDFLKSVKPTFLQPHCPKDIRFWLDEHTKGWPGVGSFNDLASDFEPRLKKLAIEHPSYWILNQTPNGLRV